MIVKLIKDDKNLRINKNVEMLFVVDNKIPSDWVVTTDDLGQITIQPSLFSDKNFWVDFYNANAKAENIFEEYISKHSIV